MHARFIQRVVLVACSNLLTACRILNHRVVLFAFSVRGSPALRKPAPQLLAEPQGVVPWSCVARTSVEDG